MKLKIALFAFASILLVEGCSKKAYVNSSATNKETIDGDAEEWLGRMTIADKSSGLQVAVSNDNENLYLCIQSPKELTNSKIILGGMQVWIDTEGKTKKTTGIKYPIGGELQGIMPGMMGQQRPDMQALLELTGRDADFVGFASPNSGIKSIGHTGDIKLLAKVTKAAFVYEVKIPFRTFFKDKLEPQDGNLEFGYTIIVNGLEKPQGSQGAPPSGMGPPPGGAGGGRPGGAGGFSGPPPGGGQMPSASGGAGQSDMFSSSKIQFKAKLNLQGTKVGG